MQYLIRQRGGKRGGTGSTPRGGGVDLCYD